MAKTNWQMNEVVQPADLNQIGQEINELQEAIDDVFGGDNQTVREQVALMLEVDTRKTKFDYSGGTLLAVVELDGSIEVSRTTLGYTSGLLSKVTEVSGGKSVTSTFVRDGNGNLIEVTKGVS